MRIKYRITLILVAIVLGTANLAAQNAMIINLKGTVTDEFGNPLYNALLVSANKANQYITNPDGSYDFQIRDASTYITVSYPGFNDQDVPISEILDGHNTIVLKESAQYEDELVDMVHHKMRKNLITGSVSTVSGRMLQKTPTLRLQESIMGRIVGLGSLERNANPTMYPEAGEGTDYTAYYDLNIRGIHTFNGPRDITIMVDGIRYEGYDGHIFTYFNPREIESISVIRDAASLALYGIIGGDGVLSITTKRGQQGEPRITVAYDHSLRGMDTERYHMFDAYTFATLRNQACINDGLVPEYSDQALQYYKDGTWPSHDYYDEFVKRYTTLDKLYLSIGGGSEYVQYMCNFQWLHTGALFNMPEYKDITYTMNPGSADYFHVASNLDSKLNYFISATFTLRGDFKIENGLGSSPNDRMRVRYSDMLRHIMIAAPTITSLYAPEGAHVEDRDISYMPLFSDHSRMSAIWGTVYNTNPYAELTHSGRTMKYATFVHMDAKVNFDFGMVTPGLGGQVGFSFKGGGDKDIDYAINYTMYQATDPSLTRFRQYGAEVDSNGYSKYYTFCYSYEYFGKAFYNRNFGDHGINAVFTGNHREMVTRDVGGKNNIPYRSELFGLNANYSYKDRYIINGTLGYSGSDALPTNNRFHFTPGVGAAWVASKEDWLRGNPVFSYLKLRGSYGRAARLNFTTGRFVYKADVSPSTWDQGSMANDSLEPEFVKGLDAGLDLTLFNCLNISGSVFKENVDNAYMGSTKYTPEFQGVSLGNYPATNTGKFSNKGYELSVQFNKQITKDFTLWAGAATWYNENQVIYEGEMERDKSYYWPKCPNHPDEDWPYFSEGYSVGTYSGYRFDVPEGESWKMADGSINPHVLFNNQEEIDACGLDYSQLGTVRPGDFKYKDMNGDGVLNYKDADKFEYSRLPRQYFNANIGFRFKRFEVSALFYGVSKYMTPLGDEFFTGYNYDGFFCDLHENAWTAEKAAQGITSDGRYVAFINAPALSMSGTVSHVTNEYNLVDGSFLKLKNAEIAYNIPEKLCRRISAQDIRVALQGQNLLKWDRIPSKYIDPETGYLGYYQPMRVFNFALNITF